MRNSENHIIHKVFLEVDTKSEKTATKLKNNAGLFFQEELFPVLEELFDKYNAEEQIIRIDKLGVDLNVSDWTNSEDIKSKFITRVEQKLSKLAPEISYLQGERHLKDEKSPQGLREKQIIKTKQNYRDTFLFFLENGHLPWYGKQEYVQEVIDSANWQTHLENQIFVAAIKGVLLKNSVALERMVFQFSNKRIIDLIKVFDKIELRNYSALLAYINKVEVEEGNVLLKYLLKYSVQDAENESNELSEKLQYFQSLIRLKETKLSSPFTSSQVFEILYDMGNEYEKYFGQRSITKLFAITLENKNEIILNLKDIVLGAHLYLDQKELERTNFENKSTIISEKFTNSKKEKEPTFFAAGTNQVLVQNAGLVLFHPFFKALFKHFDWISENGKIKENNRFTAVQTLHYCATGSEDFFEDKLILEKYLCGLSLHEAIPIDSMLNAEIKEEANNMLKAVVGNWPALKNTSPNGLQQMFVQRDGKLVQIEKGFRLIVERKAQDILMDKLPWNISIVKLPWKDDLLFVEW